MRRALRAIAHNDGVAHLAHERNELGNRIHGAECVRHVAECDDTRAAGKNRPHAIQIDPAIICQLADPELRSLFQRELLPRDEVRVMLERRDDDLVSGLDVGPSPRRGNDVYRLRWCRE